MKERPIIFSTDMVKAILKGRKTQTRRVIKLQPNIPITNHPFAQYELLREWLVIHKCPYGQPGDRLWVKENLSVEKGATKSEIECGHFNYKADDEKNLWTSQMGFRTISSRFMPRWASRINLVIVNVRVERVREISVIDAKAEGWPEHLELFPTINAGAKSMGWFHISWDRINGKRGYGWDVNPWVWVLNFKILEVKQ